MHRSPFTAPAVIPAIQKLRAINRLRGSGEGSDGGGDGGDENVRDDEEDSGGDDDVEEVESRVGVSPPIATSTPHRVTSDPAEPFNISSDGNDDPGIVGLGPILSGSGARARVGDNLGQVGISFGSAGEAREEEDAGSEHGGNQQQQFSCLQQPNFDMGGAGDGRTMMTSCAYSNMEKLRLQSGQGRNAATFRHSSTMRSLKQRFETDSFTNQYLSQQQQALPLNQTQILARDRLENTGRSRNVFADGFLSQKQRTQ